MITKSLHSDIKKLLDAIQFTSETSYSIGGFNRSLETITGIHLPGAAPTSGKVPGTNREKIMNALLTDIYDHFYSTDKKTTNLASDYEKDKFIRDLSNANTGTGTWEKGWTLLGEEEKTGKMIVQKNNITFSVEKERVQREDKKKYNTPCLVRTEKEIYFENSRFYYAFGETDKAQVTGHANQTIRFYWNLTPQGAIRFINMLSTELNEKKIAFRAKVIADPAAYVKTYSGVLYVDSSQLEKTLASIEYIYKIIKPSMHPEVPLFVKQIYPGLGFAEDPINGPSFGISRTKLIAETLYDCYQQGINERERIEDTLFDSFLDAGFSPSHPYARDTKITYYEILFSKLNLSWN